MTPNSLTAEMIEAAYFAGLFDGEGCIACRKYVSGTVGVPQLELCNVYLPVLLLMQERYGGGVIPKKIQGDRRMSQWAWQACGETCSNFLRAVYPYLTVKKEQAAIAIKLYETVGHGGEHGAGLPSDIASIREELAERLSLLKKQHFPSGSPTIFTGTVDTKALMAGLLKLKTEAGSGC